MAELHNKKNHDYTLGGHPLGNFQRVARILKQYPGLPLDHPATPAFIYMLKQFDAFGWMFSHGIAHKTEGLDDRLQDIAVYAVILRCILAEA